MNIVSEQPFIATIKNFLNPGECKDIISSSESFTRSKTVDHRTHSASIVAERTSSSSYIDEKWNLKIQERIITAVGHRHINKKLSVGNFEKIQMQLYEQGQEYQRHYDFFVHDDDHVEESKTSESILENNRIATAIIYLSDDFTGGDTWFPKLDIFIRPQLGKLLYFEYDYTREINDLTEHAGCPVIQGEKYIATSWIRAQSLISEK
jgi:prolyl 4-hydroxylase